VRIYNDEDAYLPDRPQSPFESTTTHFSDNHLTPDIRNSWSGRWNRNDMQDVIQSLRELR
jgi:hypothetical protein